MKGHIRQRGARSWEIKFDLGGRPRQTRYHSFKGTRRQAQAELTRLLAEAQRGQYLDPSRETLAEFLDRWDRDWAADNVSAKTRERYRQLIHNQIVPHIGQLALQKLRPADLSQLYARLLRQGSTDGTPLAARTVGHVHRLLGKALAHAVHPWALLAQNPARGVKPPRVATSEIEILRDDQIATMLSTLKGRAIYPLVIVALGTGLRRGELCALRWRDLDGDRLRVERSLEQTRSGGLRFKAPKTSYGRRSISLAPSLIAELRSHYKAQAQHRLALGLGKAGPDDLIFPNYLGEPRAPDGLTKEFTAAMRELGLPITLHALRHTHASQLISAGVDVLTVSRRLGHGSAAITLGVYGHLMRSDDKTAAVVEATLTKSR
jgi:integrase